MRKILLSLFAAILVIIGILLIIPFFVSTDLLKQQVATFVKEKSGMTLDIKGDVSLSLITGLALSAENVALQQQDGQPLFSVEELDFSLALSPLLAGQADITGITLYKPVFTLNETAQSDQTGSNGIDTRSSQTSPTSTNTTQEEIDLSALHIQRLSIRNGQLLSRAANGEAKSLIESLDADIRIPDFNGAAELSGSLYFHGREHSFEGQLAKVGDIINKRPGTFGFEMSSELYKAIIKGNINLAGPALASANYSVQSDNLALAIRAHTNQPSPIAPLPLALSGSLIASDQEIRLPALTAKLGQETISAAARIFTASKPVIRLAIESSSLNLDKILPSANSEGEEAQKQATQPTPSAQTQQPDLSALNSLNASLDFRANSITFQGKKIAKVKLLAHLIDGEGVAQLKSALVAKGNIRGSLNADIRQTLWQGNIIANQLDLTTLLASTGNTELKQYNAKGQISANISFAAKGLDEATLRKHGNLAGEIALTKGQFTHPALQSAIPTRESGTISNFATKTTLKGLNKPLVINGRMNWNSENIIFQSQVGMAALMAGKAIPTQLKINSKPANAALSGNFSPAKLSLNGSKIALTSPSSRALLAWLGHPVTNGTPNMPLQLQSNLALNPNQVSLPNLALTMGQSQGNGSLTFTQTGKPKLTAKIAFKKLDVTPFMGDGSQSGRTGSAKQTQKRAAPAGWDTAPIDFSGLNQIDADVTFATQSLVARDIVTGPVTLTTKLQGGQLNASLDQLSLYDGAGTGGVSVDARQKPAKMAANFSLSSMKMASFLRDSMGLKALSGTGGMAINLQTTGASQAQLMQNLNGTSKVDIRNGQIKGINIPQMIRSLKGNILEGWASSQSQSTDFSALNASFNVTNGVANNQDLSMIGPLVRLTGAGDVDLYNQRINYKANPKVVTSLKGQGGNAKAEGLPVPIIIKGKLSKPRIYPDLPGILENPQAVLQGLRNLGGGGKAAAKALENIDKKVNKTISKEIEKQSKKLGVDLNKLIQPKAPANNNGVNNGQPQQPQNLEQQLFNSVTKGLFGN